MSPLPETSWSNDVPIAVYETGFRSVLVSSHASVHARLSELLPVTCLDDDPDSPHTSAMYRCYKEFVVSMCEAARRHGLRLTDAVRQPNMLSKIAEEEEFGYLQLLLCSEGLKESLEYRYAQLSRSNQETVDLAVSLLGFFHVEALLADKFTVQRMSLQIAHQVQLV